jgi:hypothetical protein
MYICTLYALYILALYTAYVFNGSHATPLYVHIHIHIYMYTDIYTYIYTYISMCIGGGGRDATRRPSVRPSRL